MRAEWTGSGVCTSGSTVHLRDATTRASGGAAMTSTTSAEQRKITTHGFRAMFTASLLRRLSATLCRQRSADDRVVHVHAGDGRDADARRLDNVDGVDAAARTDLAGRRGVVPCHVGCNDDRNDAAVLDADVVALPPGARRERPHAPRPADRPRGGRLLLGLDRVRNCRFSAGCCASRYRDAATGTSARRTNRRLRGLPDRWRAPVHSVEGTSPRPLQGNTRTGSYASSRR